MRWQEQRESAYGEGKNPGVLWVGGALCISYSAQGFKRWVVNGTRWNTTWKRHEVTSPKTTNTLLIMKSKRTHFIAVNETQAIRKGTLSLHLYFLKNLELIRKARRNLQLNFDGFAWDHHQLRNRRRAGRRGSGIFCRWGFSNTHFYNNFDTDCFLKLQ